MAHTTMAYKQPFVPIRQCLYPSTAPYNVMAASAMKLPLRWTGLSKERVHRRQEGQVIINKNRAQWQPASLVNETSSCVGATRNETAYITQHAHTHASVSTIICVCVVVSLTPWKPGCRPWIR